MRLPRILMQIFSLGLALGSSASAAEPVTLQGAEQRLVTAKASGLEYRIFISRPEAPKPPNGFPVFYVLDANAHFPLVAELIRVLSVRPEGTGVTPAIVVGIGYPTDQSIDRQRRTIDYTPAGTKVPGSGGADAFLGFIEDELKPALMRELPIDPKRQALFGHSVGGIFVLHTLFNRPAAFQAYIAISPSIWWGERAVLRNEASLAAKLPALPEGRRVFLAAGEYDQKLDPLRAALETDVAARLEKLKENRMVDDPRDLAARLQRLGSSRLEATFIEYPGENHGSIVPVAAARALPFALRAAAP